jgi:hypothetical protein
LSSLPPKESLLIQQSHELRYSAQEGKIGNFMNLPLDNPPRLWTVRKKGEGAVITRAASGGVRLPGTPILLLQAMAVFLAITAFRIVTSSTEAINVLLGFGTYVSLALVAFGTFLILKAAKTLTYSETITLEPGLIAKETRLPGGVKTQSVERNRVTRLVYSQSRNPDGSRADVQSVELEYRDGNGKTGELSVMYGSDEQDVQWFVRLIEAWTGTRARVQEYVIDSDDNSDNEDVKEGLGSAS